MRWSRPAGVRGEKRLANGRRTIVTPTVGYGFDKSVSVLDGSGSDERWWNRGQSAGPNCPLIILLIKTLAVIMVRRRVEG
jgi:hypothetical protein